MKRALLLVAGLLLGFSLRVYAEEITILYTGETHSMLYPCNCPIQPDGGVARRATLIKEIRKTNKNVLLLDSGDVFASGKMDEYAQNAQLDQERTVVNLKAMKLMQYDAVTVGDDEFNFGKETFEENIGKAKLNFISSNIQSDKIPPYLIKQIGRTKIGIIGLTKSVAKELASRGITVNGVAPGYIVTDMTKDLSEEVTNTIKGEIPMGVLGEAEDIAGAVVYLASDDARYVTGQFIHVNGGMFM